MSENTETTAAETTAPAKPTKPAKDATAKVSQTSREDGVEVTKFANGTVLRNATGAR